ncbi:MAG TPA: OsmC family protein [Dehalococcoidia bacterium]|jgi:uncharacterized OsmC-like protein|nr:OsmC family protein [Dehalococcoidia bacterium]
MADEKDMKTIMDRNIKAIRLRPGIGQGIATTTVRVRDGVTCDVADGQWKLVADESPGDGGAGLGPDPGVFGRAALGTCLAMGYAMWSKYLGVPFDSVEVVVEAGYDARGMFGIDESVSPGWTSLRYTVNVASPADEAKVREVIDYADRLSPLLDDFRRPLAVERVVRIAQNVPE